MVKFTFRKIIYKIRVVTYSIAEINWYFFVIYFMSMKSNKYIRVKGFKSNQFYFDFICHAT